MYPPNPDADGIAKIWAAERDTDSPSSELTVSVVLEGNAMVAFDVELPFPELEPDVEEDLFGDF